MLENLKEKYVFFDVDGTLSEYRFKDQLYGGRCPELGCQSLEDLLFSNLFLNARPLKTMQNVISNLDPDKVFVLGTIVTNNEINQKYKWIEENYPNIKAYEINGEENTKIAYKYSVFSMPVFLLFIEGKESIRTGKHVDLLSLERSIDRYYNMIY